MCHVRWFPSLNSSSHIMVTGSGFRFRLKEAYFSEWKRFLFQTGRGLYFKQEEGLISDWKMDSLHFAFIRPEPQRVASALYPFHCEIILLNQRNNSIKLIKFIQKMLPFMLHKNSPVNSNKYTNVRKKMKRNFSIPKKTLIIIILLAFYPKR